MPHLDRRTDVTQVGATALALVIGRPLADDEFPAQISDMTASALALSSDGALEPLPLPFRVWLQRALQIDAKTPFGSAPEAWAELDRVLHYSDPIAEIEALKVFMARYHDAVGTAASSAPSPPQTAPRDDRLIVSPHPNHRSPSPRPSTVHSALLPAYTSMPTTNPASPLSHAPGIPRRSASAAPPSAPSAASPAPTEAGAGRCVTADSGTSRRRATIARAARATAGRSSRSGSRSPQRIRFHVSSLRPLRRCWSRLTSVDHARCPSIHGRPCGGRRHGHPGGADQSQRSHLSRSMGSRAVSRLSASILSPGRHTLKLANEGNVRSMPITITAGSQVSQLIELPRASSLLGELQVRTEPAGRARSLLMDTSTARSPLTVEGLAPGAHSVVLENELGSMTQEVKIEAGTTASLVVPLTTPKNAPVSGWIAVSAPAQLQIFEDGRLLGTSQSDRIMVSVGRHELADGQRDHWLSARRRS